MTNDVVVLVLCLIAILLLALPLGRRTFSHKKAKQKHYAQSERILLLRRNLLLKTLGNEGTVDSLIEFERKSSGNLPIEQLMQAAINRWEHDNR
jgi:hypothetical protein